MRTSILIALAAIALIGCGKDESNPSKALANTSPPKSNETLTLSTAGNITCPNGDVWFYQVTPYDAKVARCQSTGCNADAQIIYTANGTPVTDADIEGVIGIIQDELCQ